MNDHLLLVIDFGADLNKTMTSFVQRNCPKAEKARECVVSCIGTDVDGNLIVNNSKKLEESSPYEVFEVPAWTTVIVGLDCDCYKGMHHAQVKLYIYAEGEIGDLFQLNYELQSLGLGGKLRVRNLKVKIFFLSEYTGHSVNVNASKVYADVEIVDPNEGAQYFMTWLSHRSNRSGSQVASQQGETTVSS